MSKEVILTGIRANNDLTIGNYFGAIMPMIDMAKTKADQYQINLFVPDLHSFTTPIDHSQLQTQIWHNLRLFVAAGLPLDHPDIHIYRQSYVPAHSELTWILDCFTGFGEMSRMTQFKDKTGSKKHIARIREIANLTQKVNEEFLELQKQADAESDREKAVALYKIANKKPIETIRLNTELHTEIINMMEKEDEARVGLFNYPVLMAADILLYGATYVPVGEDQTQHLEFTRDIGERMNSRFGELFTIPKPVKDQHAFFGKDQGLRIKDLQDPTKKMSKSDDTGKGVIFLSEDPAEAAKKIMSATTDSVNKINLDWENQPGISNLLTILALLQSRPLEEVTNEWQGNERYGDFKRAVADTLVAFLEGLQSRLASAEDKDIATKLEASETVMNAQAQETLLKVQKAVGLRS